MSLTDNGAATEVTALPVPNLPLLRKVLDHIDAHPEQWNQMDFASNCGTTFCIAGHAVAMTAGLKKTPFGYMPANGRDWESAARIALGLTQDEAEKMFYDTYGSSVGNGSEVRANVQRVAEEIAARAGVRL